MIEIGSHHNDYLFEYALRVEQWNHANQLKIDTLLGLPLIDVRCDKSLYDCKRNDGHGLVVADNIIAIFW